MRWPWQSASEVSARYEATCARLLDVLDRYSTLCDRLMDDRQKLLDAQPIMATPKEPDALTKRIRELGGDDASLIRYFRKRAADLQSQGMTGPDLLAELGTWQTSEDVA